MSKYKFIPAAVLLPAIVMLVSLSPPALAKVTATAGGYNYPEIATPDSSSGGAIWTKTFRNNKKQEDRSCTTCHTKNLRATGKHARTGKVIDPLAPSVNAKRLTEAKKIEKWFKRNCKWTLGRECSVQEKADFLSFIRNQ